MHQSSMVTNVTTFFCANHRWRLSSAPVTRGLPAAGLETVQSSSAPVTRGLSTVRSQRAAFLLRFDKRLPISQQISPRTEHDATSRQDGLGKAPDASVLATAPRSWVGSVCVGISRENSGSAGKTTSSKKRLNSRLASVSSRGKRMSATTSDNYLYNTSSSSSPKKYK